MSQTMKIWGRIIERSLREETIIEEQFDFMLGRGMTNAIFPVRQLMENIGRNQKD